MCGYIVLRLKDYFQRARPYQTARMLDFPLNPLAGERGSPILAVRTRAADHVRFAATYEVLVVRPNASAFDASAWRALMRYAYDIGDRRVVAGVHYPTDNYASSMIFNRIVARAWPRAHAAGMRFAESAAERRVLCGRAFPELCLEPVLNTSAALAALLAVDSPPVSSPPSSAPTSSQPLPPLSPESAIVRTVVQTYTRAGNRVVIRPGKLQGQSCSRYRGLSGQDLSRSAGSIGHRDGDHRGGVRR